MVSEANDKKRTRLPAKLALGIGTFLILCAALEGGSYLFGAFPGPNQMVEGGEIKRFGQHDQLLFWSLRPYAEDENGVPWINGVGIRGPEVPPKPADEFRILSLGESTTFGDQVDYEQCYSSILETELNLAGLEKQVRVLNAGVPAYSSIQGVQYLRHRSAPFDPDMVLFYFGFNDFLKVAYLHERSGNERKDEEGLTDRELFELRNSAAMSVVWFLTSHSNFFRFLLQSSGPDPDAQFRPNPTRLRVPKEDRIHALDLAREYCAEKRIQLVLLVPIYAGFGDHIALLREYASEHGLPIVDLPTVLPPRFEKARKEYFFPDHIHPRPNGHRLIGEAIKEVVAPLVDR
ncbi:MAG: SGNH/GDSL hydrolase family protein [Planctomycetota bacterium]|jgi:lysophospholipase L1-like esterase